MRQKSTGCGTLRKTHLANILHNEFKIDKDNDLDKIIFKSKELNANILTTEKDYLRLNETYIKDIHFIKSEFLIFDENKLIKILKNAKKN